jgi:hypothetical protein
MTIFMKTRYTFANVLLLIVGLLLSFLASLIVSMDAGFRGSLAQSMRDHFVVAYFNCAALTVFVFLLNFIWSRFAAFLLWILTTCTVFLMLLSGFIGNHVGILILQLIVALISTAIAKNTEEALKLPEAQ